MKLEGKTRDKGARKKSRLPQNFRDVLQNLLAFSQRGYGQPDFLRATVETLLQYSGCDLLEVSLAQPAKGYRGAGFLDGQGSFQWEWHQSGPTNHHGRLFTGGGGGELDNLVASMLNGPAPVAAPSLTRSGSFWTGDAARPVLLREPGGNHLESRSVVLGGEYQSLALIPFTVADNRHAVLKFAGRQRELFEKDDIQFFEAVAEALGVALAHQEALWALRERVKELSCLYGVAKAMQNPSRSMEEVVGDVLRLLPPGWQYPGITEASIILDGRVQSTPHMSQALDVQSADILVDGLARGEVSVGYLEKKPQADEGPFLAEERSLLNAVAEALGVSLAHHAAQLALRERVKELTCLHAIAEAAQQPEITLGDLLWRVVQLLPAAWQYPEAASARLTLDERTYASPGFVSRPYSQVADIEVNGRVRGSVEVTYLVDKPELDEGPFLKEERHLIDEVARQVGLIVERREAAEEKDKLQQQLRHADRLATIGQLAAGAAHELNEPLGSILGFAQLAKGSHDLPVQAAKDLDKIVDAALHAREVIRKLMLFSRQMPARKTKFNLNSLVREGLFFMESRCAREGIEIVRELAENLPEISADPSQVHQVLVNLVVNAAQAMSGGGRLTIRTSREDGFVVLLVEDTGMGMSEEIKRQIFVPFFTTKEVGQGTGLGLSVVHGIVEAHGGSIRVESEVGKGSRFEVRLPAIGTEVEGQGE